MDKFTLESLFNLIWVYTTARVYHPGLCDTVACYVTLLVAAVRVNGDVVDAIANSIPATMGRLGVVGEFNLQTIANLLWSYPSIGRADGEMFRAWMSAALLAVLENGCFVQSLTSIAWAHVVADVSAPLLFGEDFAPACLGRQDELDVKGMHQLYQWDLWQAEELVIGTNWPPPFAWGGMLPRLPLYLPDSVGVAKHLKAQGHWPASQL